MNHQESNLTLLTVWSKHIVLLYDSRDSLLLKDISPIMMRLVNDKTIPQSVLFYISFDF